MHKISWKDEYMTGVEEIDRQHQDFIKLINRLNIIQGYGDNLEYAKRLMSEVGKYAEYHFISEENIMYLTQYPHLERQQKAHKALLSKYRQWMESYNNRKEVIEDIIKYLEAWFANHTIGEDKKIGDHLKSR